MSPRLTAKDEAQQLGTSRKTLRSYSPDLLDTNPRLLSCHASWCGCRCGAATTSRPVKAASNAEQLQLVHHTLSSPARATCASGMSSRRSPGLPQPARAARRRNPGLSRAVGDSKLSSKPPLTARQATFGSGLWRWPSRKFKQRAPTWDLRGATTRA